MILYVCVPTVCIKQVRINPHLPISSLNKLFPHSQKIYLYQGITLVPHLTFENYCISEGQNIIATDASSNNTDWSYHNYESYSDKIQIAFDDKMKLESAKMRDIQLSRLETKPTAFRKLSQLSLSKEYPVLAPVNNSSNTYSKPSAPSSIPLPAFWGQSSNNLKKARTSGPLLSPLEENDFDVSKRI
ncbi:hypothetical protein TVAG_118580 [Trichomonas vaginalis G3]|uniref:Ubiquitin-like domain-containing protein n=1 Tax=Trichomonas vaginalis (strain ATCC PRA-98 / G3) TaxID=412133 RepID=A2EAW1_TRIV3|nr:hypothetical protein TVAGG3_0773550 [Trichomonas vaginalis G3]EAY10206.1 hypothetical protein TVAG_118580 [Trichomonas vaginalis G3]KAI5513990.1 hypothetical protein TVAGG3_0773550 [Trichomonas vaginalis G3]|eukprot:XP_001322429.1 hypothetical protein [Trichomonas vaginalis G3]